MSDNLFKVLATKVQLIAKNKASVNLPYLKLNFQEEAVAAADARYRRPGRCRRLLLWYDRYYYYTNDGAQGLHKPKKAPKKADTF